MTHLYKRTLSLCLFLLLTLTNIQPATCDIVSLFPKTGYNTLKNGHVTVDISNVESGYIMVKHSGTDNRLKINTTHVMGQNRYDLSGDGQYYTFPLSYGNGVYWIAVYEQKPSSTGGGSYKRIFGDYITVEMPDESMSFLYPNQYVWYTEYSFASAKSMELCEGIVSDKEKVEKIYAFVHDQIRYDYIKAFTVQSNYIPDVDQTLREEAGICFDYAALFACMLRVQGIPTKLSVGKLMISDPPVEHAWNKVQIDGIWHFFDPTFGNIRYRQAQYLEQHTY